MALELKSAAALDQALDRLAPGLPADRADTPDSHVTAVRRLPAVAAQYAPFPAALDPRLTKALSSRGIVDPYTHQADAIEHALGRRNVVVITPTASGKTLCYNAPVLNSILQDPSSRALYLFPTKALAQDQLAELQGLCEAIDKATGESIGVFTYDGDTPQDARRTIRSRAHIVLSNPDMVHSGILPHHPRWAKLFENLKYVVIDELHAYRGVFGSHLCNVLRRLRRICAHYGSNPTFICSSATIANPRELAERLTEQPFELVEKSGAPRGEKFFVFVNPPIVNQQLGIRRSYLGETRRIASEFLKRNLQLIVFAQSRLSTEILTTYLKDDFEDAPGGPEKIRGYRGGYLPMRRREIEKGLREGAVRAVVSTMTKLSDDTDRRLTASAGYDSLVQVQCACPSPASPARCTRPCSASRPRISCTSCFPNASAPVNGSSKAAHLMWSTRMWRLSGSMSARSGDASKKYDGLRTTN